MKSKSIGINSLLNVIKSSLSIIFPIITYPYALRVLGTSNIGKVSYTLSIISYFSLLAKFGISTYAIREGSKLKNNRKAFEEFANNIFSINIYFTILAYLLLFLVIFFVNKLNGYKILLLIQSISLIFGTIGIEWINTIYEDYLSVTVRSLLTYLLTNPFLFLLVKNENDIYIYALISVFVSGIVSLINWNYCKKYINLKFIIIPNFKPHIKYLTVFFFNSIMVTIYVNIDITMLGWIQGDYSVGIYSTATKLYTIIKDLLTSIYLVSVPRLSYYYSQDRLEDYKDLFTNMVSYLSILLLPASIGLICVSDGAIYLLGGNQYMNAITPLQILCISLIFAQFGGLITLCVNVSIGKENTNLIGSIIGALSNAILNLFFITKWSYIGAAITTTIAEMIVFLYCFYSLENKNRFINFKKLKSLFKDILLGCILIIIVSFILHYYINHIILRTILICLIGFLIYFFILYIRKNYILIDLLVKIKKKLIKY